MQKDTLIKVLNRNNGQSVYSIPEMNGLRRVYSAGEIKEVTFEELQKLSYIPGGMRLLKENLVILNNAAAVKELLGDVEPEYSYTEQDIKKLMTQGSIDEFLDCLDFAPEGVKDIIKKLAVELPLNDVSKREALYEKTGFNVDSAIQLKKDSEPDIPKVEPEVHHRRVQKSAIQEEAPQPTIIRRVVKKTVTAS